MSDHKTIPRHIAFSVDGNRRWAGRHGLTPRKGHQAGYEVFKTVVYALADYQIPYISAHLFSTETSKRAPEEVRWLLELVLRPAGDDAEEFANHGITVRYVGRRAALPVNQQETIRRAESGNPSNPTMLLLGVDYGGRAELVDVVRRCIKDGISPQDVTIVLSLNASTCRKCQTSTYSFAPPSSGSAISCCGASHTARSCSFTSAGPS